MYSRINWAEKSAKTLRQKHHKASFRHWTTELYLHQDISSGRCLYCVISTATCKQSKTSFINGLNLDIKMCQPYSSEINVCNSPSTCKQILTRKYRTDNNSTFHWWQQLWFPTYLWGSFLRDNVWSPKYEQFHHLNTRHTLCRWDKNCEREREEFLFPIVCRKIHHHQKHLC